MFILLVVVELGRIRKGKCVGVEAAQVPGSGRDGDGHGCQFLVGRKGGYGVTW
jgi:hypothetical protein